jgi:hypothetical protein
VAERLSGPGQRIRDGPFPLSGLRSQSPPAAARSWGTGSLNPPGRGRGTHALNRPSTADLSLRLRTPNPFGQPPDARVRLVGVLPGDLQHLVHEREVGDAGCNSACRFGRLVFLLLNQLLYVCFVGGLVFYLDLGPAMDECFCSRRRPSNVGAKEFCESCPMERFRPARPCETSVESQDQGARKAGAQVRHL